MQLSDKTLNRLAENGLLGGPYHSEAQPGTVEVHLADELYALSVKDNEAVHTTYAEVQCLTTGSRSDEKNTMWERCQPNAEGDYVIHPNVVYLARTEEVVHVPENTTCYVHGKSTMGRWGLSIHTTAGLCDPGFKGTITLELTSFGVPLVVRPGQPIGQLAFIRMNEEVEHPYGAEKQGSRYQAQTTVGLPKPLKAKDFLPTKTTEPTK